MNERDDNRPSRRLILLGASNVRMSLATAIRTAQHFLNEPLDVLTAIGHGRSYGQTTSVLGRRLSGITQCGLWPELDRRTGIPTHALITDIGNDLLFGVSPQQIADWVRLCLQRLSEHDAQIVMTRLPLANFDGLSEARFRLFRTILFPKNRQRLSVMRQLAKETDERIGELRESFAMTQVAPRRNWYGLDPIHLKYRRWNEAYGVILRSLQQEAAHIKSPGADLSVQPKKVNVCEHVQAMRWQGAERYVFGRHRCCRQPIGRLRDGTTVSLY